VCTVDAKTPIYSDKLPELLDVPQRQHYFLGREPTRPWTMERGGTWTLTNSCISASATRILDPHVGQGLRSLTAVSPDSSSGVWH